MSDASVAADLPKPAVRVEAVGTQITERISWDQGTITHEPQVLGQSAHLWTRTEPAARRRRRRARLRRVHLQRHLVARGLGFCGIGEAKDWLDGGRRIALDGELPVNPHGGQLSEGRTHGFGFVYEAMAQLRHEAGERQVPGRPDGRRHLGRRHTVGRPAPAPGRTGSFRVRCVISTQ